MHLVDDISRLLLEVFKLDTQECKSTYRKSCIQPNMQITSSAFDKLKATEKQMCYMVSAHRRAMMTCHSVVSMTLKVQMSPTLPVLLAEQFPAQSNLAVVFVQETVCYPVPS